MGRVACSAAAALRAHPATTSLETAAVLLDSQAMAANRVSAAGTTSASTAFLSIWTMSIFLWTHSCIYKNTPQDTFMMNQKAGTSLTNGTCELPPSLHQLVFQEHSDRTVTGSVSAPRQTSSATQCLDPVTALRVSTAPNVTKVCTASCLYLSDMTHRI